jgi:hypothetical protein
MGYVFHDISIITNFVVARIAGRPYHQTVESQFLEHAEPACFQHLILGFRGVGQDVQAGFARVSSRSYIYFDPGAMGICGARKPTRAERHQAENHQEGKRKPAYRAPHAALGTQPAYFPPNRS